MKKTFSFLKLYLLILINFFPLTFIVQLSTLEATSLSAALSSTIVNIKPILFLSVISLAFFLRDYGTTIYSYNHYFLLDYDRVLITPSSITVKNRKLIGLAPLKNTSFSKSETISIIVNEEREVLLKNESNNFICLQIGEESLSKLIEIMKINSYKFEIIRL